MITLRKVLFKVLATSQDEQGFEYEILESASNGNHRYRCTYHHVREDVEDLVIDANCGQNEPEPADVMEMVWQDMNDYFMVTGWGQDYVEYLIDELGYTPKDAKRIKKAIKKQIKDCKRFFGKYWDELTAVDFRYKAFEQDYHKKMLIGFWDHRHPDSEEWYRIHAYIDWGFNLKHNQVPSISVTYWSNGKDHPDSGGGGAGVPRLYKDHRGLYRNDEWEAIMALERLHLWKVDGTGLHWIANASYWLKEGNIDAAKRGFGWGIVPDDVYEDTEAFTQTLTKCQNKEIPELIKARQQVVLNAMWDTILKYVQSQYREPLEIWATYCRQGNWKGFFDDLNYMDKKEADE